MNILKGLKSLVGVVTNPENSIVGLVKDYFPPSMSDAEKAELAAKIANAEHIKNKELIELANVATEEFNDRIKDLEGTASDLKTIPYIGGFIIFLRGCQRPVWGFATMYFDSQWFFSSSKFTDRQEAALMVINVLVLAFLFGERALINLQPVIKTVLEYFGNSKKV